MDTLEGVIVLVPSKTTDQDTTLCGWYQKVTGAIRNIIDETPGGAIVIHVDDLPELIADEDSTITDLSGSRLKAIGLALRRRQNLSQALYRDGCLGVIVIYDPERTSLLQARCIRPNPAYAQSVMSALPA